MDIPEEIKLLQLLGKSEFVDLLAVWWLEEDGNDAYGNGSNRQVDVEAPPPAILSRVGEDTAEEGTSNRGNTKHTTNETSVHWPLAKGNRVGEDDERTGKDTGTSETSNRTTNNEGLRGGRNTANQRTKLENTDCGQEGPFEREKRVDLPEQ